MKSLARVTLCARPGGQEIVVAGSKARARYCDGKAASRSRAPLAPAASARSE